MTETIFDELKWRGLIHDTMDGSEDHVAKNKVTLYNGFDLTAGSLHVGHMVPLIGLARWQRFGHTPIAIAGGGTSMIGDPSGRSAERNLLSDAEIAENLAGIQVQLSHFLDFDVKTNPARIINNADWLCNLKLLDFLRDIGKHFTVSNMMSKDSVKNRLDRESGLSFTEFSYQIMQGYDFLYLYEQENCTVQTGGSDQWGNIVGGADLIRRKNGKNAYGVTYPLIKKSDGTKFGKTASGAIWLDPKRTSPYKFYQFWLNTADADVCNYLRYFTFLDQTQIGVLDVAQAQKPEMREAHRALADEMTLMMHGSSALKNAQMAARALFGGEIDGLSAEEIRDIFDDVPSCEFCKDRFAGDGMSIQDILVESGFLKSKAEAKRAISEGGISVNNRRVVDFAQRISISGFIEGQYLVLRRGKKNYFLVKTV